MRNHRKLVLVFLILLPVAMATAMRALNIRNQNGSPAQGKAIDESVPTADAVAPEPADPKRRSLRKARGKRHNGNFDNPQDAKIFRITENSQSGYGGFSSHAPPEAALPASQSDTIVIGEVTDAHAYLSDDGTSVYSEFALRVDEVLKRESAVRFNIGDSIDITRGGGAVRFPSGKVYFTLFREKPFPRKGRRYLFFLKSDEEGQSFAIITGYELRAGRVHPLDGSDKAIPVPYQLAAHQKYEGADEAAFLNDVREAITRASLNTSEGGR
ncbi:MAG: hypothetical protein ABR577_01280 [Pyrinomonadaceae bacterium]